MKVICAGSRTWDDYASVASVLDDIARETFAANDELTIVHGACPTGADALVDRWARRMAADWPVRIERYPARWSYGKGAGFIRNQAMVDRGGDLAVGFIRDGSRGASHTIRCAQEAGIPTRRIDYADIERGAA